MKTIQLLDLYSDYALKSFSLEINSEDFLENG